MGKKLIIFFTSWVMSITITEQYFEINEKFVELLQAEIQDQCWKIEYGMNSHFIVIIDYNSQCCYNCILHMFASNNILYNLILAGYTIRLSFNGNPPMNVNTYSIRDNQILQVKYCFPLKIIENVIDNISE